MDSIDKIQSEAKRHAEWLQRRESELIELDRLRARVAELEQMVAGNYVCPHCDGTFRVGAGGEGEE